MAGNHQPDGRCPQGFEKIEIFFTGNSEDRLNSFVFESPNE